MLIHADRTDSDRSYLRYDVRMTEIVATARLRARNQLTLPDPIVQAAGLDEGATFVVEVDETDTDVVRLRRVRSSYAGALKGLYEPSGEYLSGERAGWDRR
jgi:bifunctional DNA-binding transcriptional regulator/antitoxin component of YhaV-PrlF toxin-antitoxin module